MEDLLRIGAAYIRVSDERQDEYSPDSQLKKIREYAARDGVTIPDEYVFYDDGISGKNVKKRDDFNRMIAIAKEKTHPFDVIYVWKFSRFARNQEQAILYKNLLRKNGVSVVSVSEPIPEGPFGTLIERVIEWMDEFYLINLGTEVSRGMAEKFSRGEPTCAPPFGYIMRDKMYYPDEESGKADIVRDVFALYVKGTKQREIANILSDRGIRTKRGNIPDNRFVDYILTNPCYIGKLRRSADGKAVSQRHVEDENIMVTDGHHDPIISMELWDEAQKIRTIQKKSYPKYARREQPIDYMLKGLVRCSACGATLVCAISSQTSRRLQCHNYSRGTCRTSHSILVQKIEDAFKEGLRQAIGEKKFTIVPNKPKESEPKAVDYDKLIEVEQRRLARAKEAYLAEIDTIEQYAQNKKEITERIEGLKSKRDKQVTVNVDMDAFSKKVLGVLEFIEREDVTATAKNEALHTIIEAIIYEKAKGNLAIIFHDL